METPTTCPECGAAWQEGKTCQDDFHGMLFWEAENPELGVVHHLMVLCYHLQHPSLYSPEGLETGMQLLSDFLERGLTPEQVRKRNGARLGSDQRSWKIKATPASKGSYPHPLQWSMTAADVTAGGVGGYNDLVRKWARSVLEDLRSSGNLAGRGGAR